MALYRVVKVSEKFQNGRWCWQSTEYQELGTELELSLNYPRQVLNDPFRTQTEEKDRKVTRIRYVSEYSEDGTDWTWCRDPRPTCIERMRQEAKALLETL